MYKRALTMHGTRERKNASEHLSSKRFKNVATAFELEHMQRARSAGVDVELQ
jgi:hypothetical protein